MGLEFGLVLRTLESGQRWKRDEVYDAVFAVRVLVGLASGIIFGLANLQGLPAFLGFIVINYVAAMSWLNFQGISTEEIEIEGTSQPLSQEGFPVSISLFMLCWITTHSFMMEAR